MAAYTSIDDPSAYFQIALHTGNGGTQSITNDGNSDLQPDFVWIKGRSTNSHHALFDSVRGATKRISSSETNEETTESTGLTSFNSDGWSTGAWSGSNSNNQTYVSWQWKSGTSFSNDASATSIGTIDSTGSVNDTAGFSIVSYTSTGSNGSIKHGLSTAPSMIIFKRRSGDTENWPVYHQALGATKNIKLNLSEAVSTSSTRFNDTEPTSSVFSLGTSGDTNGGTSPFIAYCFAEKKGYSKFGSYTGNGNADGAFIYTGFKPAFFMAKRTDANDMPWVMIDNKRNSFNALSNTLLANSDEVANTGTDRADFLSQGVKIKTTSTAWNASGAAFIFMAFAESPFVSSSGVPTTAR